MPSSAVKIGALVTAFASACVSGEARAEQPTPAASAAPAAPVPSPTPVPERFSFHAQATDTQQYHGGFASAYAGPQSLSAKPDTAKTVDATLFLGTRLWKGGEIYVDPELDQGFGLGRGGEKGAQYVGTVGVAGFTSAEAYKVGSHSSYGRVQRAFVRQRIDLGGDRQSVDPDLNVLGTSTTADNLIVTAGKFAVTDVFDNNAYAHDPKHDFLNWSIVDMGAFDYAADAWGYTYGASGELTQGLSTFRAGLFQLSKTPNAIAIEHVPLLQYSPVLEFERRTSLFGGHPGAVKALAYADVGYMGAYDDAVDDAPAGVPPSTAAVRFARHAKVGAGINIAQEIAPNVGVFARASAMNGTFEAFEFSDIDRSVSTGVSVDGAAFKRANDTFGLAGAFNGISAPARQYFAAGGLGILVGDGALSYGGERILETYYSAGFSKAFALTFDYQFVGNPAYDVVRGPVSVFGLRFHAQI